MIRFTVNDNNLYAYNVEVFFAKNLCRKNLERVQAGRGL